MLKKAKKVQTDIINSKINMKKSELKLNESFNQMRTGLGKNRIFRKPAIKNSAVDNKKIIEISGKENIKSLENFKEAYQRWQKAASNAFSRSYDYDINLIKKTRPNEWDQIIDYLNNPPEVGLYITGRPGTGKTALVSSILNFKREEGIYKLIEYNAMLLFGDIKRSSRNRSFFSELKKDLVAKKLDSDIPLKNYKNALLNNKKLIIIFIDEIDHLYVPKNKDSEFFFETLYQITGEKVWVIGVSNSIDKRNKEIEENRWKECRFDSYSSEDIFLILQERLRSSIEKSFFMDPLIIDLRKTNYGINPTVLEVFSKKAAALGDIRKSLDYMKQTIEMVDICNLDMDIEKNNIFTRYIIETSHLKQFFEKLNLPNFSSIKEFKKLNIHLQILIASIYLVLKEKSLNSEIIPKIIQIYRELCQKSGLFLSPVLRSELIEMLYNLEAKNIISISNSLNKAKRPLFNYNNLDIRMLDSIESIESELKEVSYINNAISAFLQVKSLF